MFIRMTLTQDMKVSEYWEIAEKLEDTFVIETDPPYIIVAGKKAEVPIEYTTLSSVCGPTYLFKNDDEEAGLKLLIPSESMILRGLTELKNVFNQDFTIEFTSMGLYLLQPKRGGLDLNQSFCDISMEDMTIGKVLII